MLRKNISINNSGLYLEESCHIRTEENRTMIAPKTDKGKAKRLNGVNLQRCTSEGMYFRYERGGMLLANYTTQQTYYSSGFAGVASMSENELQDFLAKWIADTDEEELERIHAFAKAKRRHCKFKEGDFRNNGIGWSLNINKNILEKCIEEDSNEPYWERNGGERFRSARFATP